MVELWLKRAGPTRAGRRPSERGERAPSCRRQRAGRRPSIKIQLGVEFEKTMTYLEKQACRCLLKDGGKVHKRKISEHTEESKYINCDFITGAAAVVESLWSEQDNLLANKRRRGMTPMVVECILFLKKNKDLWTIRDVNLANEDRKAEKRIERIEEKKRMEKELADLLDELNL